jgi:biotin transport system substrate-specific component
VLVSGARIARIAVFAALIGVFGATPAIPVPGTSVPITAQTVAVMLTGLMLVPLDAFLAGVVFLALVLVGLPLMPGGFGGVQILSSVRGGFAIGFPVSALAVSLIATGFRRIPSEPHGGAQIAANVGACIIGGIAVLYAVAVPIGAALAGLDVLTLMRAMAVYIPGDLAKAVVASVVAASAFRAAPFLRPSSVASRG